MAVQLSLTRVLVFAPNLDTARKFYGEVLGLLLTRDDDRTLTLQGPNFVLNVFECKDPQAPNRYSQRPGMSVVFAVRSLEEAIAELSAKGVQFLHTSPKAGPVGRYVAFADPFGTVFELMEQ